MDEFHFYADPDRGWAWQVPLLELPHAQFLLMSATLGDVTRFEEDLTRRTGRPTAVVALGRAAGPAALLVPDRRRCTRRSRSCSAPTRRRCTSCTSPRPPPGAGAGADEHQRVHPGGEGRDRRADRRLPVHHRLRQDPVPAGPARHRRAPRRHAARSTAGWSSGSPRPGLLKVICGTDTLGVGVNVPIRTVLFTAPVQVRRRRRSGSSRPASSTRSPAGPAGPASTPPATSSCQAPDHVVENEKALAKAGDDPKKRRKVVRKKPPEGFVVAGASRPSSGWSPPSPEPLTSSFAVSHAMLLNVISRPGDAFAAMRHLLHDNHEDRGGPAAAHPAGDRDLPLAAGRRRRRAARPSPTPTGRIVRLTVDLQEDFALNQPLSHLRAGRARAARPRSRRLRPGRGLGHRGDARRPAPDPVGAAVTRPRGEAVAAMKADGIEYEERMELLEEVTYPQPLEELLRRRVRDLPARPPVGRRPRAVAQVGGPRHVRAGDDLRRVRRGSTSWPAPRGWCCATSPTPTRRCARPCPTTRKTEELHRPHRVARRAGPPGRLQPARRVGAAAATRPAEPDGARAGATTGRRRSPPTPGRSGCWSATRCSAGSSWPRCAATTSWASWTPRPAGTPRLGGGAGAVLRRARRARHRARTPAARPAAHRGAAGPLGVRQIFDDPAGDHDWGIAAEVDLAASDEEGRAVVHVIGVDRL